MRKANTVVATLTRIKLARPARITTAVSSRISLDPRIRLTAGF
jgi:hypothetical protein